MSLKGNVYKKVCNNVSVGDYLLKIVYNGQWKCIDNPPDGNVPFYASTPCDVTITYNPATDEIKFSGKGVCKCVITVTDIYVAGELVVSAPAWVNGEEWNVSTDSNKTVRNSKGIYTITYKDIPAGE